MLADWDNACRDKHTIETLKDRLINDAKIIYLKTKQNYLIVLIQKITVEKLIRYKIPQKTKNTYFCKLFYKSAEKMQGKGRGRSKIYTFSPLQRGRSHTHKIAKSKTVPHIHQYWSIRILIIALFLYFTLKSAFYSKNYDL